LKKVVDGMEKKYYKMYGGILGRKDFELN